LELSQHLYARGWLHLEPGGTSGDREHGNGPVSFQREAGTSDDADSGSGAVAPPITPRLEPIAHLPSQGGAGSATAGEPGQVSVRSCRSTWLHSPSCRSRFGRVGAPLGSWHGPCERGVEPPRPLPYRCDWCCPGRSGVACCRIAGPEQTGI